MAPGPATRASMHNAPLVAIFAKAPIRGRVKTRLAVDLGPDAALDIYRRLLARTLGRLSRGSWRCELWVTPDAAVDEDALWPVALPRRAQGEGDLGARMIRALAHATADAPAIVVGTDIPDLDTRHIDAALAALERAPLTFGPSRDGGFYLVGARGVPPGGLFADIPWSSAETLARCLDNAAALAPELIEPLDDLDDLDDLERHRGEADWQTLLHGSTIS